MNPAGAAYWRQLARAATERGHPMRVGALATVHDGQPQVRMVVLRSVDIDHAVLCAYTDRRSGKVAALKQAARAEWMFYDSGAGLQLRLAGPAEVHQQGDAVDAAWAGLHAGQRREYQMATAPGTPLKQGAASVSDTTARQHFAVLSLHADRLDVLQLERQQHHRTRFCRHSQWAPEALTP
ncbi:MAG: pyridoxamine 5'-phosphate oxidase family protein [Abyssibacter sp.]|uniref:pyridoxamine 5'-phosphate oxidase family protein n=1 Tax=Abyssibacter sp. TaxID=2320200 RepID=UPI00321B34CE